MTPRAVRGADRLRVTAGEAAAAMAGTVVSGDPGTPVSGWSIDSRTVAAGDMFFAVRGPRFDGHAFVEAARQAGAAAVVASEPVAASGAVIRVADTIAALQALARHVRRQSGARVVAITGSVGKTTTKEATAAFLAAEYRVFRNKGNLNNHIGLPLSLLNLVERPDVAVVELGMNHAGEIRTLVGVAEPDVRVWTNVAEVHTEFFPSLEAVADAKAEILEGAGARTLLVANADDPLVAARVGRFPGRLVTFGFGVGAAVAAEAVEELGIEGVRGVLRSGATRARFCTGLLGRANVANVLAAAAVALQFGIPLETIAERAAHLAVVGHRGAIVGLRDGITLLDDSYNSNPRALGAMFDVLARERGRRIVAVLGEMLELGEASASLHAASGRAAVAAGVAELVAVGGPPARALADAARAGLGAESVWHVATSAEAADIVAGLLKPGDLVFVKGSRGVGTDVVVDRLKAERG
jgi:UDP-N-acetylmuramoyl-tripeptide--D-alanyl-D-alanine ligase